MPSAPEPPSPAAPKLRRVHLTRLRHIYRSAGWPCHDPIEIDLLAAGCLMLLRDDQGRETLRPTPEGLQALAQARQQNQVALDAHDALVHKVALQQHHEGRFAWTDLSLRVRICEADGAGKWVMARPDVFSVRHTTVEAYL